MRVVVIDPPAAVVTWEEAQSHLRLDGDDEKGYVETLIAAAQAWIDGPAGWLGRAIGVQTLELQVERPESSMLYLPYPPILQVIEAEVDGVPFDVSHYVAGATAISILGASWQGRVRVRYRAGYGVMEGEGADVALVNKAPAPIKVAILLIVAHWYKNREAVAVGGSPNEMPFAADALLSPYRVYA